MLSSNKKYWLSAASALHRVHQSTAFISQRGQNYLSAPSLPTLQRHFHHSTSFRHISHQASKHPDELPQSSTTAKSSPSKPKMSKKSPKSNSPPGPPHAPSSLFPSTAIDPTRTKLLTPSTPLPRPPHSLSNPHILYWMMRDVRTVDNWALLFAQSLAVQHSIPLRVAYVLPPPPAIEPQEGDDGLPPNPADMSPTERHGTFTLEGLRLVADELNRVGVTLDVLRPPSRDDVGKTMHAHVTSCHHEAVAVVCDMSPLRRTRQWIEGQTVPLLEGENVPVYQVDAHNIVPVWMASNKREVGARTLRPKIHGVFGRYCCTFPEFVGNAHLEGKEASMGQETTHDWEGYKAFMKLDESIKSVPGMKAGREAAMARWKEFCTSKQQGLKNFDTLRNDPNYSSVCTNLSPYINHGQISFQRLSLEVRALKTHPNGTAAFIEEGVVRRELSDNFVYYTPDGYDSLEGAADWARESLELHAQDEREHLYTWRELERGETHDDLWNAGQLQLVREGGLHGFMRMYWAKKILEWTISPSYALATAQYFNDRYAYDGNDPNGFVGVGWSIMGIHDMGWKERPIFGKIRYMNYAGCKRKFKIDSFVARYKGAKENAVKAERAAAVKSKNGSDSLSGKKRKA
eukprot:CCRYP_008092-RC/>CCRYP_008092-RC protein AED:0.33 eAED:0.33 QI:56/1/1/1/0.66/0.5/4/1637/629